MGHNIYKQITGILLALFSLLFFAPTALAVTLPQYNWTKTFGGSSTDTGYETTVDASGNVYVTGTFSGSNINFNQSGGTDTHSSSDGSVFVSKYSQSGNYLWTKNFGASTGISSQSMAIDSSGNVFIAGYFQGSNIDFDPSAGSDTHSSNGSAFTVYLTKLTSDGSFVWTKSFGGASNTLAYDVALDSSGNAYLTGYYTNTTDFDASGSTDSQSVRGFTDVFITKYANDGTYGWTKTFGKSSESAIAYGIATDSSNNVYAVGDFGGSTVDFDPSGGTDNHSAAGGQDVFITKLSSTGTYIWTKTIGGTGVDLARGVATDSSSNVYTTGYYSSSNADFDPSGSTDTHAANGADHYVIKLASDGSYGWTQTPSNAGTSVATDIAIGSDSNIYVAGYYSGTQDFDPTSGTDSHTANGNTDIFATVYSTSGTYQYTIAVGGSESSNDYGYSIATYTNGNFVFTGQFAATTNFNGSGGTDGHDTNGDADIFISSYGTIPSNTTTLAVSNASGAPQPSKCATSAPRSIPDLFQIKASHNSATAYYTTPLGPADKYAISYGYSPAANNFSVEFSNSNIGVHSYTLNFLEPNTTYYIKMRAGNGCMPGEWGSPIKIKTTPSKTANFFKTGSVNNFSNPNNVLGATVTKPINNCGKYTVQSGDSLWSIAKQHLGAGSKYTDLIENNNLPTNKLKIGQNIDLGC